MYLPISKIFQNTQSHIKQWFWLIEQKEKKKERESRNRYTMINILCYKKYLIQVCMAALNIVLKLQYSEEQFKKVN